MLSTSVSSTAAWVGARTEVVPLVTEAARYVLALSIVACFAALGIAIAIWVVGRRSGDSAARSRGLIGMLVALVAVTLVLLLALVYAL